MPITDRGWFVAGSVDERGRAVIGKVTDRGGIVFGAAATLQPVIDAFNRADSMSGLGIADTGQTWQIVRGNFGIYSNEAFAYSVDSMAVIECLASDGTASLTPTFVTLNDTASLVFRYTDSANYWFIGLDASSYIKLVKVVGGTWNTIFNQPSGFINGDVVSVELYGADIGITINGVNWTSYNDSFNVTGTKYGMMSLYESTTVDNFSMVPLVDDGGGGGTIYPVNLSDSVTISETFSKKKTVIIIDSVDTSDSENDKTSKSFIDSVSSSDSISSTKGKAVNLSDSVVITESIRKALTKSQSDSVVLVEADSQAIIKAFSENLIVSDSITVFKGKSVILSDSINVTDSIKKAITKIQTDTATISDSMTKRLYVTVKLYDIMMVNESIQTFLPDAPSIVRVVELFGKITAVIELSGEVIIKATRSSISLEGDVSTTKPAEMKGEV